MKIGNRIIRDKYIKEYTEDGFLAEYKGRTISISTDHGHGKPKYIGLKRFNIDVWCNANGMTDVMTYEDHLTIEKAILSAIEGACL